ncbi:MAG: hypothetical protein ACYC43_00595 [Burkholderiales bacterium]
MISIIGDDGAGLSAEQSNKSIAFLATDKATTILTPGEIDINN